MPSITVLDGAGASQSVQTLPAVGQSNNTGSLPVALSTEQQAVQQAQADSAAAVRPAATAFAVTTSDSVNFTTPTRGLYVGGAGNVSAVIGGVAITFTAVPAGVTLPIVATRVNATGTTATNMVGLA